MNTRALPSLIAACLLLAGCEDWPDNLDVIQRMSAPPMEKPRGIPSAIPPQDTPEQQARAVHEREDLPKIPSAPDTESYSNLGTVPPKPVMPTEKEIAGQITGLATEANAGMAVIQQQADAPDPVVLPKPASAKGTPSTTPPALPASPMPVQMITPTSGAPLTGEATAAPAAPQLFRGDNSAFLPQSESIEREDLQPGNAP